MQFQKGGGIAHKYQILKCHQICPIKCDWLVQRNHQQREQAHGVAAGILELGVQQAELGL